MNIPITKEQIKSFRNDKKQRFLSSGSEPNRKKRREHTRKDIKKPRMVIYTDHRNGSQHKSIEYYQFIETENGIKKIQHFK